MRGEQQQVHQGRMGKVSLGGSIGGGVVGGIGSALTLLGRWNETEAIHGANGMGQTPGHRTLSATSRRKAATY